MFSLNGRSDHANSAAQLIGGRVWQTATGSVLATHLDLHIKGTAGCLEVHDVSSRQLKLHSILDVSLEADYLTCRAPTAIQPPVQLCAAATMWALKTLQPCFQTCKMRVSSTFVVRQHTKLQGHQARHILFASCSTCMTCTPPAHIQAHRGRHGASLCNLPFSW